jgi:hypothetical protein
VTFSALAPVTIACEASQLMSYAVSKDWRGRFVYNALQQSTLVKSRGLLRLWLLVKFHWNIGRYPGWRRRHAFP